jgi:hypothetical protein
LRTHFYFSLNVILSPLKPDPTGYSHPTHTLALIAATVGTNLREDPPKNLDLIPIYRIRTPATPFGIGTDLHATLLAHLILAPVHLKAFIHLLMAPRAGFHALAQFAGDGLAPARLADFVLAAVEQGRGWVRMALAAFGDVAG